MARTTADPQDVKSEEALLGAILLAPGSARSVAVKPDDFYRESHGLIWAAAKKCAGNGGCDPITVSAELERRGELEKIGGREKLHELAATVPAPGNAGAYAKRIAETAEYRRIRRAAMAILEAVPKADDAAIAAALEALGTPTRYVDIDSGEIVADHPKVKELEEIVTKKEHRERSLLSQISKLEGKAEKKAKEHKLWDEIAACFDIYRLATGHFEVTFTPEEFGQALPRWKQYGKGSSPATETSPARGTNPCKPALRAICGIAYDPTDTRGRNKKQRVYDSWELMNRNQFSWADFHKRVPTVAGHPSDCDCEKCDVLWWRCLMDLIEGNLKK